MKGENTNEEFESSVVEEKQADYGKVGNNRSSTSIDDKELEFKFQLIKGRIAENIIQELFISEGYQVYKYGIEDRYPSLLRRKNGPKVKKASKKTALSLRVAPDLVIEDIQTGDLFYAEVKYRRDCTFITSDKMNIDDYRVCYPGTIFFIVTPIGIFAVNSEDLCNEKVDFNDDLNSKYSILNSKNFNLRGKTITKFEELSRTFLSGIPTQIT